jgi:hypothetical protein
MNTILTSLEAYKAMICFLDSYYNKTLSDDLGSLLGDLQLFSDCSGTFDPAAWHDWIKALGTDQPITIDNAFRAMINFLNAYYERTSSVDIKGLIDSIQQEENKVIVSAGWSNWLESINEVIKNKV